MAHCHTKWDDDASFERQRQEIRHVLDFDGNRAWRGKVSLAINDDLDRWHHVLAAVEAGAYVELRLP